MTVGLALWLCTVGIVLGGGGHIRPAVAADDGKPNACGCHQGPAGMCVCERKAKCGCPGECEPKGCDEKRSKQLEKEIQAETKKAAEADRHRAASDDQEHPASVRAASKTLAASAASAASNKSANSAKPVQEAKPPRGKRLSAAQKKELTHLLDLYVGENPDHRRWTIEQVDDDLSP